MKEKLKLKTKKIGLEIILLIDELPNKPSVWAVSKQIIRCATSIGANYRAACMAKSNADFINKLKIVEEESDETIYWLEIMEESHMVLNERIQGIKNETKEILAIVISSLKTIRARN